MDTKLISADAEPDDETPDASVTDEGYKCVGEVNSVG